MARARSSRPPASRQPASTPGGAGTGRPLTVGEVTSQVFPVYFCEFLGGETWQWYEVVVTYVDGEPVSEEIVSGPYTGAWQPYCPGRDEPSGEGSSGGAPCSPTNPKCPP